MVVLEALRMRSKLVMSGLMAKKWVRRTIFSVERASDLPSPKT